MSTLHNEDRSSNGNKKLNTTQIILIAGFVFLIAAIAVAGFFIYKSMQKTDTATGGGNLIIDESNLADIEQQLQDSVQDGMFEVNMNTTWTFPDAKSPSSDAVVVNSTANHYAVSFDILLGEEQEVIYSSTVIPTGSQIKEIILDKELSPGNYDAVCNYHLLKDDGTEKSTFGVDITLIIKE